MTDPHHHRSFEFWMAIEWRYFHFVVTRYTTSRNINYNLSVSHSIKNLNIFLEIKWITITKPCCYMSSFSAGDNGNVHIIIIGIINRKQQQRDHSMRNDPRLNNKRRRNSFPFISYFDLSWLCLCKILDILSRQSPPPLSIPLDKVHKTSNHYHQQENKKI